METADDEDLDHDARWQGVRDLVRYARETGFDEDPPARIDAILMAAARQHVPEKRGAFERVRKWLVGTMLQPAVAGAVAVAVIGGAAGVFYLKGKRPIVEPTISTEPRSAPPAAQPDRPELAGAETGSGSAATFTTGSESAAFEARLREIKEREGEGQKMAIDRPRDIRPKGGDDGIREDKEKKPDDFDFRPDGRDTTTVVTTGSDRGGGGGPGAGGGGSTGGAVAVGGVKTQIGDRPDPQPPPPSDDKISEEIGDAQLESPKNVGSTETTGSGRSTTRTPSKRTQAENLLKQARTAATKKDCSTVKTMAKRAKQLDAAYYQDTFSRDAAVKNCL